eukprot:CAMPEP_0185836528 /NCGR_PEP_ID=MMETSP1353-20130828/9912_1 /TAXON_ID=1077150 /ORGANISM="Erythrolobus australicus, Strain CCMP3124" /LENGTH=113 /DNA_ID=CAMNT_0028535333 /DNA_START=740 /DNA_END=1081 /DNA_ORIENTATION=+
MSSARLQLTRASVRALYAEWVSAVSHTQLRRENMPTSRRGEKRARSARRSATESGCQILVNLCARCGENPSRDTERSFHELERASHFGRTAPRVGRTASDRSNTSRLRATPLA